jgi:hypothetical protein
MWKCTGAAPGFLEIGVENVDGINVTPNGAHGRSFFLFFIYFIYFCKLG